MAFKIMEQGRKPNTIWQTFFCDTNDDIANLPTNCPAGSRAIVAQNGDLYLLDSLGNWNPMPRGSGGSNVVANPTLSGSEPDLSGLEVDGVAYKVSDVVANPTLSGSEPDLSGLEVDGVAYAIPSITPSPGISYVVPGSTTFMGIVSDLTNQIFPVINDTVNGRAYYISGYTMVGGQPAAITFSTLDGAHTWTVDYQDNWTST